MPIHIENYNRRLVEQDNSLRTSLEDLAASGDTEAILAEGLCAIHERLGNMMILMIQTGGR